jgi:centromeric protein E
MFEKTIKQKIPSFINGINLSVFAYGQTSTGKTFTMNGSEKNPGIIPLTIEEIFKLLGEDNTISKFILKASYLELYNETVNDLLNPNNKNLEVRESAQKGVFVNNLTETLFTSKEKALQLLKKGDSFKITAETKLNEKSSRSHSIFRISLEVSKNIDGKNKTFFSQINLIDLAGSENVSKAKTEGIRMKEGSNINKSLLALSNVISKLSSNPKSFVNFRDSKLTRLLQNGLSGNSKTTIICTISEIASCNSETLNTLHFGNKAKNIKTDIKINELKEQNKMMIENNELKNKIKLLEELIKEKKTLTEEKDDSKKKQFIKTEKKEKNQNQNQNNDQLNNINGTYEKIFSEEKSEENLEDKNKEMQM